MAAKLEVATIFFDWGGTLAGVTREADHWPDCAARAVEVVADEVGWGLHAAADLLAEQFAAALAAARRDPEHREVDTRAVLAVWAEQMGLGSPDEWPVDRALDAFWHNWVGVLDPIEGAAETLAELSRRGYRLGLVSNVAAVEPCALAELERLGLRQWADACTFSSTVGYRKPHPAIYDSAIAAVHGSGPRPEPSRMLFVGDGPIHDVAEPQRRGMKTALVRSEGLDWPADQLRDARPDLRVDRVIELLDVLPPRASAL